jgi:hypothetical protein
MQTHAREQTSSNPQNDTAHADASPSHVTSSRHGMNGSVVLVLLTNVHDVLVVVVVDEVDARAGPIVVDVVGFGR